MPTGHLPTVEGLQREQSGSGKVWTGTKTAGQDYKEENGEHCCQATRRIRCLLTRDKRNIFFFVPFATISFSFECRSQNGMHFRFGIREDETHNLKREEKRGRGRRMIYDIRFHTEYNLYKNS